MNGKILLLISVLFISSVQLTYAEDACPLSEGGRGCSGSCAVTTPLPEVLSTPGHIEDPYVTNSDLLMRRDLPGNEQSAIPNDRLQQKVQLYNEC